MESVCVGNCTGGSNPPLSAIYNSLLFPNKIAIMPKMKFVLIFGPPAVGKMAVGMEIAKETDLRLFHNHMTIELVLPFFEFGSPAFSRLVNLFRRELFKEVANSDLPGIIFTFVWAFGLESEEKYVSEIVKIFEEVNAEIHFVELEADLSVRLKRNKSPLRLQNKASKRNTKQSELLLLEHDQKYRFNSLANEVKHKSYIRINNSELSAKAAAAQIITEFKL